MMRTIRTNSWLKRPRLLTIILSPLLAGLLAPLFGAHPALASGVGYHTGDVFAAIGDGKIKHFSSTGTLLDTLDSATGSAEDAGMAFDLGGNLYSTQFTANTMVKFDNQGNRLGTFGSGFGSDPESVVRDHVGNFYVGQADGSHQVLKFDANGTPLATFSPAVEKRGTDWIDLAADQCTLFYTSEGKLVKRFNVCTNAQLPDFATLPITGDNSTTPTSSAYALRIRPNQEVMVATASAVFRLSPSGTLLQTYTFAGTTNLFALNLDADLTSFWTGDIFNGQIFKTDVSSGATLSTFNVGPGPNGQEVGGLAVFGEVTAAQPKLTLAPTSATRQAGQSVTLTAQLINVVNPQGTVVTFTVTGANAQTGTGTADNNGTATFTYTGNIAGTDTVVASANPALPPGPLTSNQSTITWNKVPTTLTYNGATTSDYHDPATLSARLTDSNTNPVPNKPITFTMATQTCIAATDASGTASCPITPIQPAGTYTVTATFTADAKYLGSSDSRPFTVTREETTLTYTGDTHIANGTPAHLSGVLTEDATTPIAGRTVTFTLGSGATAQSCNQSTDTTGTAACTITVAQPGPADSVPVTATFNGDTFYQPATASTRLLLQFMTGRAFGISSSGLLQINPIPDTGPISTPSAGTTSTPCVATITGLLTAHALCANVTTAVNPGTSTSTASVADANIGLPLLPAITLRTVQARSQTTCSASTGQTTIDFLQVGSVIVVSNTIQPGPNTTINVLGIKLILNEQIPVAGADKGLTVNAVHIIIPGTLDVIVASATSDAHNCP
jgi:hypothetical protein